MKEVETMEEQAATNITSLVEIASNSKNIINSKFRVTGSFPLSLDSNSEIASRLVGMQIADLGIDYLEHRNALIEAVTVEDIKRVADELIDPDSFTVVVVGDPVAVEPTAAR